MVRIKERYLVVKISYPAEIVSTESGVLAAHLPTIEKLTPQALLKGIRAQVALLFGDYGLGGLEGRLSVKYLSLATSTIILKCARAHAQMLWAALTFMTHVPVKDGRACVFRVVRVSGTIRKAEEDVIRQSRIVMLAARNDFDPGVYFPNFEIPRPKAMIQDIDDTVVDIGMLE